MEGYLMKKLMFGIVALVLLGAGTAIGWFAAQTTVAHEPAQPAPSPETPEEKKIKEKQDLEKKILLPITEFYDTPDPFPKGKPGELIRFEKCEEYRFPFTPDLKPSEIGIKAVRFLYHSQSASGQDVPASGVVLIPYGKPPAGGWPVIVWAHGTSGVGRPFAPSLMKDLYYSWEGLLQWPMLGYAVVAPDYAGLGTKVPHQYLAAPAQAHDVLNAVPAARQAVPELGARWLAIGHSQGGSAVLATAEMQSQIKDDKYLGAIALAPSGDLEHFGTHQHNENRGYSAFLAFGIKSVYPKFEYADFLTPTAVQLMPEVEKHGLDVTLAMVAAKVPPGKMLLPKWKENPQFQEFRKLSLVGQKPTSGPMLLLQGMEDTAVTPETSAATVQRLKKQGAAVEDRTYPGLDHDALVFGSFKDQLRWVQDRFDSKPVPNPKAGK
jgi:pimeloyl-ACP methyl ester carboxylesterase